MEVLRLHSPVPKEGKCIFKDDVLPDGTKVYAGEVVGFTAWSMGRDKEIWGDNASDFEPNRFFDKPKPSPYAFTVFQVKNVMSSLIGTD